MNTLDDWLTNVGETEHKSIGACDAQVKDTSSVVRDSLEAMGPIMNGKIKVMTMQGNSNGNRIYWFITPTEGDIDFYFYIDKWHPEFENISDRLENGEKPEVTFNVQNSQKGPMAVNVTVAK